MVYCTFQEIRVCGIATKGGGGSDGGSGPVDQQTQIYTIYKLTIPMKLTVWQVR